MNKEERLVTSSHMHTVSTGSESEKDSDRAIFAMSVLSLIITGTRGQPACCKPAPRMTKLSLTILSITFSGLKFFGAVQLPVH